MYPGVREEHLRELQRHALIRIEAGGEHRRFLTFQNLLTVRRVHGELRRGASFRAVLRALKATRAGQLTLDFRNDAIPAKVVALTQPPVVVQARAQMEAGSGPATLSQADATSMAEQFFAVASRLDDGTAENLEQAAASYRRALEIDPRLVPAVINLANIHYARDELIEAQALYEHAVSIDPDVFEGHFNLGNIHHDLGRYAEAEGYYRHALATMPGYAEAHLYLAVVLEKAERSDEARVHWQAYRNLAPDGEWAELAREFCET